jgi:hypothetical protein
MADININIGVTGSNQAATELNKTANSLTNLSKTSNTAGQSLTNLGRVAQDAPFGFIGIQNNINPLFESFTRLRAETGSTGGAFKALAGSLAGPAGIGLAISAATALLTVLSQNGFFSAGKAAEESSNKVKEFSKSVESIQKSVAAEQANVLTLVSALKSETVTREEKAAALKKLQDINPKYFGDLKLEGNLVNGLSAAYTEYSANILKSIQNKIDSKRLEDVLVKINTAQEKQVNNQIAIKNNEAEIARLTKLGGKQYADQIIIRNQQLSQSTELIALERQRDEILKKIASRGFEGVVKEEPAKKATKNVETYLTVLEKLKRELNLLSTEEITLNTDKTKEKISSIESAIGTLAEKFKLDPKGTIIQQLFGDIKDLKLKQFRDSLNTLIPKSELGKSIDEFQSKIKKVKIEPLTLKFKVVDNIQAYYNKVKEINKETAQSLTTLYQSAFSQIGQSIGEALASGGNVLKAALESVIHLIGKGLQIIGEGLIALGNIKSVIEKLGFTPGPTAIIAGIVAVAAGAFLQNFKIPGFANGVNNFSGGMALVGERGPELVRLPTGSDVIPNHRLNSLNATDNRQVFIPNTIIRGSDIVISYNRQTATNRRNG